MNCVESVLDDAVIFADRVNTGPGFGSFVRAGAVEGKALAAESLQARILHLTKVNLVVTQGPAWCNDQMPPEADNLWSPAVNRCLLSDANNGK